jgi:hypothetical protein
MGSEANSDHCGRDVAADLPSCRGRKRYRRSSGEWLRLLRDPSGFVIAELYSDYDPHRGDVVVGSFSSYGFKTLFF